MLKTLSPNMKKVAILSFLAGVLTMLALSLALSAVNNHNLGGRFQLWTQNGNEKIVSVHANDSAAIAELQNTSEQSSLSKNMTSSRWGEKRVVIIPENGKQLFVNIELKDGEWRRINISENGAPRCVNIGISDEGSFDFAQIIGGNRMLTDQNVDGTIDSDREYPPTFNFENKDSENHEGGTE